MCKTKDAAINRELSKLGWKPEDKFYALLRERLLDIDHRYGKLGRPWRWNIGESWEEYASELYRLFGPEP